MTVTFVCAGGAIGEPVQWPAGIELPAPGSTVVVAAREYMVDRRDQWQWHISPPAEDTYPEPRLSLWVVEL